MEAKQRKERFITLLNELLEQSDGIKLKLAQKLNIKPPTLTRWFQGKIDPATLELSNFLRLSEVANVSADELAQLVGILPSSQEEVLDKFQTLVKDLLSSQSLEELGSKLGVTHGAISGWLSSKRKVNPGKVYIGTITALAIEKGWTLERLLIYLGLKQPQTENNLLFKMQTNASVLSLNDRVKFLAWLSNQVQQEITQAKSRDKVIKPKCDRTIVIVLEQEDMAIASKYSSNLVRYVAIEPENITIATIPTLPDSLEDINVLIFDVSNADSPSLALIQDIDFDGDIVVFSAIDLPEDVREAISAKVTDVAVKPIDWSSLKDKPYFT